MAWTPDSTERWLTKYPLPADFTWGGVRAWPRYQLKEGYGFWLRHAGQYYPELRGLFAECHEILLKASQERAPAPAPDEMAERLRQRAKAKGAQEEIPLA